MDRKIYIGNLSYFVTEDSLRKLCEPFGDIARITIPIDAATQRGRGFAFVEFYSPLSAARCIDSLDGTEFLARNIRVAEATRSR